MNVLIVDTCDNDKAPALAAYLTLVFAAHGFTARGVNQKYCTDLGTDYLQQADINAANLIVFADEFHYEAAKLRFPDMSGSPLNAAGVTRNIMVLNIPDYYVYGASAAQQTAATQAYMTKAQTKLTPLLT